MKKCIIHIARFGSTFALRFSILLLGATSSVADEIEEVIVTAEFREVSVLETGNSISVIGSEIIAHREARHLILCQIFYTDIAINTGFS